MGMAVPYSPVPSRSTSAEIEVYFVASNLVKQLSDVVSVQLLSSAQMHH